MPSLEFVANTNLNIRLLVPKEGESSLLKEASAAVGFHVLVVELQRT